MDERQFDRITRRLAERPVTRRSFLGLVGGVAAGGLAVVGLGERAQWSRAMSQADSEEQSVMLLERMAEIIHAHTGGCAELSDKVSAFLEDNRSLLAQIGAEQNAWSEAHLTRHADMYGDRRLAAIARVKEGLQRCKAVNAGGTAASPGASPVATPAPLHEFSALTQSEPACQAEVALACFQPRGNKAGLSDLWEGTGTCTSAPVGCSPCDVTAADCFDKFPEMCSDPAGEMPCTPLAFASENSCIYTVQAACYENQGLGTEMVPGSQFTATAKCDKSGTCEICDPPSDYCESQFPNTCTSGEACSVAVDASQSCTTVVQATCLAPFKVGSGIAWTSEPVTVYANCDAGPDNCTFCNENNVCATLFPDNCDSAGSNVCGLQQEIVNPPPSKCCNDTCPISTWGCVGFAAGMATGEGADTLCLECAANLCGSTSHCLSSCASAKCCVQPCGAGLSDVTSAGTPIAAATPGTPAAPSTLTASGTPVPPTVALPTQPPPTVALPTDVAVPTQPPPTVALPTEAPPTEPPATPATPSS